MKLNENENSNTAIRNCRENKEVNDWIATNYELMKKALNVTTNNDEDNYHNAIMMLTYWPVNNDYATTLKYLYNSCQQRTKLNDRIKQCTHDSLDDPDETLQLEDIIEEETEQQQDDTINLIIQQLNANSKQTRKEAENHQ